MDVNRDPGRGPDDEDDVVTFHNPQDLSNRLFDLRWLIGALFAFYGVVLIIASFFVSSEKAGGVNINLWLGLGMLALGLFFLAWGRLRPLRLEGESAAAAREHPGEGTARSR